uniref:RNA-directed DNA polymerase n=1 Tax=Tanacetum cinerariifolium TaxID=118510 RepID=A0A6L2MCJ4_TANCI|nr:reverse transcriptase domain-containing protein [Tanacetum cinerariifolium]
MRTHSNFYPSNFIATIPKSSNRRRISNIVELKIRSIAEIVLIADRTMEELLQAPTEGYGEAIVIPEILAENFEIKTNLLQDNVSKTDDRIDKLADQISNLIEIVNKQVIALAKAVEKTCVTCGGAHAYYECIATDKPNVPRTQTKPTIPYPSRLNDQKLRKKATNQMEKFFQIFHDLHFDIRFANALLLMPKFASTIKSLLMNKDKIFELAKVPLNENCSAMLLKKLPEKLGDLGKFLIPIFSRDGELTPTRMTLKLADRSITHPKGVTEDVFVKVGKFHFLIDFIVVDFEADPRVPLILRRSFLRTGHALIDVYGDNPTLVFDNSIFESDSSKEPIVKSSSPTLKPFGESDFFQEEIEDFLNDDSIPTRIENFVSDPERDSLFLKKLLNEDPFQLPSMDLKLAKESKAKSSFEKPPELDLKELPSHLDYAFLEDSNKFPVIIAKNLKNDKKTLINVLKSHKLAIAWKIFDIKGFDPTHKILMEDNYKPAVQSQRRPVGEPNPLCSQKGGMTVVANVNNELIPMRLVTGWRVCIDYRKLNDATRKDHFPLPFMDQMLERLARNEFYCFLDGFSGYFQISINPQDLEKTTFTCPYGTFAYRRMPFGLGNAPGTFQRCMMSIFHDMIEKTMEVFMDDFLIFGDREGIVLGHKISKSGIEVDRAKVDVIAKLTHSTTVKGVRSFLGHAGFYRHFIQDFSKIARPMTRLLEKETPFVFSKECIDAVNTLKKKRTEALILVVPDWNLPFELMCDASDYAIGAVLGQRKSKHFQHIYYASKTMTEAQIHYTTTEKEMLAVVYAFEKFRLYLVLSKSRVYTDHSALKYLLNKQDANPRLENPQQDVLENKDINENFPLETLTDNFDVVFMGKKLLKFSKLAMRDLLGAIMVPISQQRRSKAKSLRKMRCLITVSKFVRYSLFKWVEAKVLPINDARVVVKFLKSLFSRFSIPRTYENSMIYKERTKKLHDSMIKNRIFNVGDQVLLFNSRHKIFSRKLRTRWSGPFTITRIFPYGTIKLSQPNGLNFKVNGPSVKPFSGDIPSNVALDLHTFLMDN